MFEAYKVATRIDAIDATGGTILRIAAQFSQAGKEASGFLSTLKAINTELGRTVKGWGAAAAEEFAKATRAARNFNKETGSEGVSGGGRAPMGMPVLARGSSLLRLPSLSGSRAMSRSSIGGGLMPWPSDFGAGHSGRDASTAESRVPSAEQLSKFGSEGLGMLDGSVNAAIAQEQATNRLTAMNLGAGTTSGLLDTAKHVSETTPGLTFTDAIKLTTDTQGMTSNADETKALLPGLAKMRFGISAFMGEGQGEAAEAQFQDIVKAMQVRGLMNDFSPDKATTMEDMFTKSFVASGGQVDPTRFVNTLKSGGDASKPGTADPTFAMGHMLQETGEHTAAVPMLSGKKLVADRSVQTATGGFDIAGPSAQQVKGAMGVADLAKLGENSAYGNLAEYHKQVNDLEATLGKDILPLINKGLAILNPYLRDLTKFTGEHGTLTAGLVTLFAGVSTLASVAGGIKKFGGAITAVAEVFEGGGLAASVGSLGAALEGLAIPMAAVLGAAGAGAAIGTAINDHLIAGTKLGDKIGHGEAWVMAKVFRSKEAQDALDSEAKYASLTNGPAYGKPATSTVANITVPVTVDGREIGRVATSYQLSQMSRPQSSTSYIDTSRGVQPTGYTGIK